MNRVLKFLAVCSGVLIFGCVINYVNPATDYVSHIGNCSSTVRVQEGNLVAGVSVINLDRTFTFAGWINGTCAPIIQTTDTRVPSSSGRYGGSPPPPLPQNPSCRYTQNELEGKGVNSTLVLLLSRCGIPRAQSVLVFDDPFPQYELNSS